MSKQRRLRERRSYPSNRGSNVQFRRTVLVVGAALLAFVSCAGPQQIERATVKAPTMQIQRAERVPTVPWPYLAAVGRDYRAWLSGLSEVGTAGSSTPSTESGVVAKPLAVPAGPWACIATAETGQDWTMHGSTYSTAFGMVNDIIYDYGTPEEQAAVFSGTATEAQQTDIASRFAADHGFGGWGELTKTKCGL